MLSTHGVVVRRVLLLSEPCSYLSFSQSPMKRIYPQAAPRDIKVEEQRSDSGYFAINIGVWGVSFLSWGPQLNIVP